MVEYGLPKPGARVRFPLPAPRSGAKETLLRFFCQKTPPESLLLRYRKKSRSARLLGCKRPRDVSLSLPTFCEGAHYVRKSQSDMYLTAKETLFFACRGVFVYDRLFID